MKTFEEACAVYMGSGPEHLAKINGRTREIRQQIKESSEFQSLALSLMSRLLTDESVSWPELIFQAFAYGVGVGIEMEKAE